MYVFNLCLYLKELGAEACNEEITTRIRKSDGLHPHSQRSWMASATRLVCIIVKSVHNRDNSEDEKSYSDGH